MEKLPILDPWSVMGAKQGIPGPAPAKHSPESHPTHGQLSPALDQQTPVPAPVRPSPTPTWSGPSPPSQPAPNPASPQPAPAQPTGGERGATSGRRVRSRPAEGAPPEAEPGLCSPPARPPPGPQTPTPDPGPRTPDPGPAPRRGGRACSPSGPVRSVRGSAERERRRARQRRLCHLLAPRPHCTSRSGAARRTGRGPTRGPTRAERLPGARPRVKCRVTVSQPHM